MKSGTNQSHSPSGHLDRRDSVAVAMVSEGENSCSTVTPSFKMNFILMPSPSVGALLAQSPLFEFVVMGLLCGVVSTSMSDDVMMGSL